jgi:rare lipoprotein A
MILLKFFSALALTSALILSPTPPPKTPSKSTSKSTPKTISKTLTKKTAYQYGNAVLYSKSLCGKPVAKGGNLNCDALTAAHRKLPFGTKIRVTNLENDKTVVVKINDRGPYSKKDILDMTPTAAKRIGLTMKNGRTRVRIDIVK